MDWLDVSRQYLDDSRSFPWQWYGGVPTVGPTHIYILRILIGQVSRNFRSFAEGKPSFRELSRVADGMKREDADRDELIIAIWSYCEELENKYKHSRASKPEEVFKFITNDRLFIKDFQNRVKLSLGLDIY